MTVSNAEDSRYKTLIQTLPDAVIVTDISGIITDISNQALTLFESDREENLVGNEFFDFIAPESKAKAVIYLHKTLKQSVSENLEYSFIKRNGQKFIGEVNLSLLKDKQGRAYRFIATIRDITARKQAEIKLKTSVRDKELLLQEIHHRVKNNLQIVSSILDMCRMRIQDSQADKYIANACSKIQSMAFIHSQLYRNDHLERIDMRSHIQDQMHYLSEIYDEGKKVKTYLDATEVFLSLEQAIPCALVLNELISNAFKHAFSRGEEGVIEVFMRLQKETTVVLQIRDNGKGIPNFPDELPAGSLGLKLVRNLVEKQLKGSLQISPGNNSEFSIVFDRTDEEREHV